MELFWRYTLVLALVLLILRSLPLDLAVRKLQFLIFPSYEVSRFHLAPSRHSLRPATVKVFNFTLTYEVLSPNGVSKRVFTINGQFQYRGLGFTLTNYVLSRPLPWTYSWSQVWRFTGGECIQSSLWSHEPTLARHQTPARYIVHYSIWRSSLEQKL